MDYTINPTNSSAAAKALDKAVYTPNAAGIPCYANAADCQGDPANSCDGSAATCVQYSKECTTGLSNTPSALVATSPTAGGFVCERQVPQYSSYSGSGLMC